MPDRTAYAAVFSALVDRWAGPAAVLCDRGQVLMLNPAFRAALGEALEGARSLDAAEALSEMGLELEEIGAVLSAADESVFESVGLSGPKWDRARISRPTWIPAGTSLVTLIAPGSDGEPDAFGEEPVETGLFSIMFPLEVLIVDDNLMSLEFADKLFQRLGYQAKRAETGEEALEICRRHPVQLVMTDLQLPGIDGYELLHRIKSMDTRPPIQVFASSANDLVSPEARSSFDGVAPKPISLAKLKRIIMEACGYDRSRLGQRDKEGSETRPAPIVAFVEWEGEPALHRELIETLLATAPPVLSEVAAAARSEDWKRFEERLHYLKGGADIVRADRLAFACKEGLASARAGTIENAEPILAEIRSRWSELTRYLRQSGYTP